MSIQGNLVIVLGRASGNYSWRLRVARIIRRRGFYAIADGVRNWFDLITGCVSPRPVLYPNDHTRHVGGFAADRDIDDCIREAEESRSAGGAAASEPGTGASVGVPNSPAAAISGLFGKPELSPGHKVVVNKCLRDRGYDPVGWN